MDLIHFAHSQFGDKREALRVLGIDLEHINVDYQPVFHCVLPRNEAKYDTSVVMAALYALDRYRDILSIPNSPPRVFLVSWDDEIEWISKFLTQVTNIINNSDGNRLKFFVVRDLRGEQVLATWRAADIGSW